MAKQTAAPPAPSKTQPAPATEPTTGMIAAPPVSAEVAISPAVPEVAQAFLGTAKGKGPDPTRIPVIEIDHQGGNFVLPTGEVAPTIDGYPVYYFQTRKWYKKAFSPGQKGTPPDCWSADLVRPSTESIDPQGGKGGACAGCPQAVFGSGRDGKSQACAVQTWVFLINSQFGTPPCGVLVAPPSSISVLLGTRFKGGYFAQAKAKCGAYQIMRTKFSLGRPHDGSPHCVLVPEALGPMTNKAHADALAKMFNVLQRAMDEMRGRALEDENVQDAEIVPAAPTAP